MTTTIQSIEVAHLDKVTGGCKPRGGPPQMMPPQAARPMGPPPQADGPVSVDVECTGFAGQAQSAG